MISEICILSAGLEPLLKKTYRNDVQQKDPTENFVQKFQQAETGSLLPVFNDGNIHYFYIQRNNLIFLASSAHSLSPVSVMETLNRIYHIFKDFCGTVSENSVKSNILLLYEVLDEIMDYGYVQLASTEKIKPYVNSEPVVLESSRSVQEDVAARLLGIDSRVVPFTAANKPVIRSQSDLETRRNEIFLDVVERLTAVLDSNGMKSRLEINGSVNMKNFLIGSPQIHIAVNEDLVVRKEGQLKGFGQNVQLDRCSFHQSINLEEFENSRVLKVHPQTGEFSVMTYSASGEIPVSVPLRVMTSISDIKESRDIELVLKLKCEIPRNCHAVYVLAKIKVPKSVRSVSQSLGGSNHSAELNKEDCVIIWKIKKLGGGTETVGKFRLISQTGERINKKEIGPVILDFEVSGFTSTGLQIRYMRVFDQERSYVPFRWIRYITVTDSFIVKLV